MDAPAHLGTQTKSRLSGPFLGSLMILVFLALPFLGSAGCGCGDDEFPFVRDQPAVCCCEFDWMPGPNVVDQDVVVSFTNVDPSLDPLAQPPLLVGATAGEFSTFRVCVRDDHALGASTRIELRDADTSALLGSADLFYDQQCAPGVEQLQGTILYSTDCGGQVLQCCCTYEWLADLDDADVVVSVVGASPSLQPVVVPSTFANVSNQFVTFSVCVNVDHAIGSSLTIEFRNTIGNSLFGSAVLTYGTRCDPTIEPGIRTTIFSTDCGGGSPRCCCDIEWRPPVEGGFVSAVRIEFENVDAGLNPTSIPDVATGVSQQGFALYNVCVSEGHPLGAQMTVVLYNNSTAEELGRLPLIYNQTCVPTPGDPTGRGTFLVLCNSGSRIPAALR